MELLALLVLAIIAYHWLKTRLVPKLHRRVGKTHTWMLFAAVLFVGLTVSPVLTGAVVLFGITIFGMHRMLGPDR